jgi:hypothetical protein
LSPHIAGGGPELLDDSSELLAVDVVGSIGSVVPVDVSIAVVSVGDVVVVVVSSGSPVVVGVVGPAVVVPDVVVVVVVAVVVDVPGSPEAWVGVLSPVASKLHARANGHRARASEADRIQRAWISPGGP